MLFLTDITETFVLAVASSAVPIDWTVGFVDMSAAGATAGSAQGTTAATTTVVVAAPGAGMQRQLKSFTAFNKDAAATQTVTLTKVTGAGTFSVQRATLAPSEVLVYVDSIGFKVVDAQGRGKTDNLGVAASISVTDDATPAVPVYPTWVTANTGNLPAKVTSTKLSFLPSTGVLSATGFTGALTGNASTATKLLTARSINGAAFDGSADITVADATKLPLAGGTVTGRITSTSAEALRSTATSGFISGYDAAGATRQGYIQFNAGGVGLAISAENGNPISLQTASVTRLQIDASGNVGIGDSSPPRKLSVALSQAPAATQSAKTALLLRNSDTSGTSGSPSSVALQFAYDPASVQAAIECGTYGYSFMRFDVGGTERMRIDAAGRVGIGTSAPAFALDVNGQINLSDGASLSWGGGSSTRIAANNAGGALGLYTANTERVRIDANGSLLIGLTSTLTSLAKLQISDGTINSVYGYKYAGGENLGTITAHPLGLLTNNVTRLIIDASGNSTFSGLLSAPGFGIGSMATSTSGTVGFINTNGPAIQFFGTATAPAGGMYFLAGGVEAMRISGAGNVITTLTATPPGLATNSQMAFNLTSNTNLRVSVRGTDGTTRVANLTLA